MKKTVQDAVNKQLNREFNSAYIYLAMASYAENENLLGIASWLKAQSREEMDHAMKFYSFLNNNGSIAEFDAVPKPINKFKSVLGMFEEVLKHEKFITSSIHELYELSSKEKDYALQSFLKWFIDEQVEEESNVNEIIAKIQMVGEKGSAMYLLDKELGNRKA